MSRHSITLSGNMRIQLNFREKKKYILFRLSGMHISFLFLKLNQTLKNTINIIHISKNDLTWKNAIEILLRSKNYLN